MTSALLTLLLLSVAGGRGDDYEPPTAVSVHAVSRSDVWAAARRGEILHFDGSAWKKVALPLPQHFGAVWASGRSDVWVGGEKGALLHYDGASWKEVPTPTKNEIRLAWGSGPSDVWFAIQEGPLLHWDGKAVALVEPGVRVQWMSMSGTGPSDVWLVGSASHALHFDGKKWALVRPEFPGLPPGIVDVLKSAWFVSVWARSPGDATALLFLSGTPGSTRVMRFKESAWTTEAELDRVALGTVWGSDARRFAAGVSEEHESRGGGRWTPTRRKASPVICSALSAMHGTGAVDVWALSRQGRCVLHWDGTEWIPGQLP